MNSRFTKYVTGLEASFRRLLAMRPVKVTELPRDMPAAGIYLFSDGARHKYVGRSNRLRARIQRHARPGATHRSAAFAFRWARKMTGRTQATYKSQGSRASLIAHPVFAAAFARAKKRIRRMSVRYVAEPDPLRQALLEIYVAVALATPFNDFDTH